MKKTVFYLAALAIPFYFGCGQGGDKTKDAATAKTDSLVKTECFKAIDGKDTADLKLNTLKSGKIKGDLLIKYQEKGANVGEVEGKFKGDTLFVDFTFKIGENKTQYKNPLALLKHDGKLVLGVGQIETSLGRSYFVKGKPISFDRGRFTFIPSECKK